MRMRSRLVVCSSNYRSLFSFFQNNRKAIHELTRDSSNRSFRFRVVSCEFVDRIALAEHSTSVFSDLLELRAVAGFNLFHLRVPASCISQTSSLRSCQE